MLRLKKHEPGGLEQEPAHPACWLFGNSSQVENGFTFLNGWKKNQKEILVTREHVKFKGQCP